MEIIPAVDIKEGRCVQLVQGDPNKKLLEIEDPVEVAKRWVNKGANYLHLIDLDAALGEGDNLEVIKRIVEEVNVPVEVGGGIRDIERALELIELGVDRIIVGTKAITDSKFLDELNGYIEKDRIVLAVESKEGKVVIKGWKEKLNLKPIDVIEKFKDKVGYILYTNVDVEGLMKGIKIEEIKNLIKNSPLPVIYSGGVTKIDDIITLKELGAYGVVIGSALYKGKISLREALKVLENEG
ncbi:phosphoribosylformimino-5-aminoimidazole carboxamide ribotide isomerase [Methanocaldococcus infernus ME]|uniref:1-(5-phosphoribosyl)-5-[(5-phosphoribosylamino)methylideneamino] imidazole-4-carboxamide isomerase n=1 Tax=Methanocaldococcus infernus (strain DSM 11812 / JCM 15783 / ME) TaxID=573063 RepID=D5VS55_METIM|nr:1-(5-phosphoribosyl)-5-[(5-phosphoribosylamino)methylideneamino]imidazole-4-carboxamide isomerase [Methanocaldococcus infernus]ADG13408.1 phosphoribosylformimino-5-aminoimidazole carboxamide ribotide isomerase [Methanocaldococcus infernus ME]